MLELEPQLGLGGLDLARPGVVEVALERLARGHDHRRGSIAHARAGLAIDDPTELERAAGLGQGQAGQDLVERPEAALGDRVEEVHAAVPARGDVIVRGDHDDPVEEVFEDQIACADLVILSKSDLMDAVGTARANGLIGEHLSRAVKIVPTSQGKVDASVLLGLGLAVEDDIENRRTHHDGELDHEHDDFDSFIVELPGITDPEDLARRVTMAAESENVLRVKGFVEVDGKPMRMLLQAVGPRVNHYYDRAWTAADDRRSRLVVIGLRGLDRGAIEKILVG